MHFIHFAMKRSPTDAELFGPGGHIAQNIAAAEVNTLAENARLFAC